MIVLLAAAWSAAAVSPAGKYVTAQLIAESDRPQPGRTILVGFRMVPKPGWHGYWSNPGEAGIAPTVRWSAPTGVKFGPLLHPAPTLLSYGGVDSYVHSGPHVLLARMIVGDGVALGTPLDVTASLNWAACTETMCVPERAKLTLRLLAGDGEWSADAAALRAARDRLPAPVGPGHYSVEGGKLTLALPVTAKLDLRSARFFPDANGFFDASRASARAQPGELLIKAPITGAVPSSPSGVVSDGLKAYRLAFRKVPHAMTAGPVPAAANDDVAPQNQAQASEAAAPPKPDGVPQRPASPHPALWGVLLMAIVLVGVILFRRVQRPRI